MQLGMIGLGRMGANMVRRLIKGGHECVAFDVFPKAVEALAKEKAVGASSLQGFRAEAGEAASHLADGAGGGRRQDNRRSCCRCSKPGDILIDGGNSYYIDDIRRAKELAPKKIHYVDVGTSGGVWGLERGYCMMIGGEPDVVKRLDPIFATLAPGIGNIPRTPGREKIGGTAEQGYLHCGPERRRPFCEDGAQRHRVRPHGRVRRGDGHSCATRTSASTRMTSTPRRRRCAIRSIISTISTCATSPKCGGAAA